MQPHTSSPRIALALLADANVVGSLHVCLLTAFEAADAAAAFDVHVVTPPSFAEREIAALERTLAATGRTFALHHVRTDVAALGELRGLHGNPTVHLKWVLTELLPGVPRFIILDTDLIVRADLAELWATPLGDRPVAAVQHGTVEHSCDTRFLLAQGADLDAPYFNAGVILVDAERWSAAGLTATFHRFARERSPELNAAEQTVYNAVLGRTGRIAPLDTKFNQPLFPDSPRRRLDEHRIYHLISAPKPWDPFGRLLNSHAREYFAELARTAYRGNGASASPVQWIRRTFRLSRYYAVGIRTRLLRLGRRRAAG